MKLMACSSYWVLGVNHDVRKDSLVFFGFPSFYPPSRYGATVEFEDAEKSRSYFDVNFREAYR